MCATATAADETKLKKVVVENFMQSQIEPHRAALRQCMRLFNARYALFIHALPTEHFLMFGWQWVYVYIHFGAREDARREGDDAEVANRERAIL